MHPSTARLSRGLLATAALAGMLMLVGCDNESEPTQALVVNMPMAVPAQYPTNGTVLAWMRLDGGSRVMMDVDTGNETVSGVFNNVSSGDHNIEIIIEFDYTDGSLDILELGRISLPVVADGSNISISFEQNDYSYANDDTDTYPNVVELMAGSDPLDGSDEPLPGSVADSGRWNTMRWDQTNWR